MIFSYSTYRLHTLWKWIKKRCVVKKSQAVELQKRFVLAYQIGTPHEFGD